MNNRHGLNRRTRELSLTVRKAAGVQILECCLCGADVLHGAVEGAGAERVFRAQVDAAGTIWVPVKGHAHPVDCPDPEKETARFWANQDSRDAYKAQRRREADRRRVN